MNRDPKRQMDEPISAGLVRVGLAECAAQLPSAPLIYSRSLSWRCLAFPMVGGRWLRNWSIGCVTFFLGGKSRSQCTIGAGHSACSQILLSRNELGSSGPMAKRPSAKAATASVGFKVRHVAQLGLRATGSSPGDPAEHRVCHRTIAGSRAGSVGIR